jgi:hypothetical protein
MVQVKTCFKNILMLNYRMQVPVSGSELEQLEPHLRLCLHRNVVAPAPQHCVSNNQHICYYRQIRTYMEICQHVLYKDDLS